MNSAPNYLYGAKVQTGYVRPMNGATQETRGLSFVLPIDMGDIRRPPRLFLVKGTKGQRINLYDQNMNSVVARWLGRLLTSLQ